MSVIAAVEPSHSTLDTDSTAPAPAPGTATDEPPVPLLLRLPPELLDLVLSHVAPDARSYTAASLSRVFPDAPPAYVHRWRHVVVGKPAQLLPLYRRIQRDEQERGDVGGGRLARTFAQQAWRGDADMLNNVLRCLPALDALLLNCGTNFAPEHLQEMFDEPRPGMRRMEVRFRPYVEKASYYQFLKGSYFDTAIRQLSRNWPEMPNFSHFSIVQDLPPRNASYFDSAPAKAAPSLSTSLAELSLSDPSNAPKPPEVSDPPAIKGYSGQGPFSFMSDKLAEGRPKNFAQPIVFFDIRCLGAFGAAPVARHITHLRLRVPSREIAHVLISNPIGTDGPPAELFPALRYLDLSTTNVRLDAVLATLLRTYARLEHLILDRVNLFGFKARDSGPSLCRELGGAVVAAGLARGKERERQIAAWELAERTRLARAEAERRRLQALVEGDGSEDDADVDEAELARREQERHDEERRAEMERNIALARSRRGHRSAAHSTFSLRDRPLRARGAASAAAAQAQANLPLPDQDTICFVLPPLPTLKTLCIGGEAQAVAAARTRDWEENFHAGWRDGLAKLLGWAAHVADKYERALKRADEWRAEAGRPSATKGKAPVTKTKPPTDVRLFAFPPADADRPARDPADPTVGLVEVAHDPERPRAYLAEYRDAIADAELWTVDRANRPPCVLCVVPDCEGPLRRGAEGEKVDGRGGMDGVHNAGCGHLLGRGEWGWEGIKG
ncbi:hypothetical protein Q5752_000374 [Cryptotrichosporon argae]